MAAAPLSPQCNMKPDKMATGNISEVVTMYQTLLKDWNKKPANLEKCGKLLSSLKVMEVYCCI